MPLSVLLWELGRSTAVPSLALALRGGAGAFRQGWSKGLGLRARSRRRSNTRTAHWPSRSILTSVSTSCGHRLGWRDVFEFDGEHEQADFANGFIVVLPIISWTTTVLIPNSSASTHSVAAATTGRHRDSGRSQTMHGRAPGFDGEEQRGSRCKPQGSPNQARKWNCCPTFDIAIVYCEQWIHSQLM